MVIKMPRYQRDIDVAAFANRLAIVECFEHREPARMFLHLPGQRIQITRTRMWSEGLPRRQGSARGLHRAIHVCHGSLRHCSEFFASGRICGVEIGACHGCLPCAVNEMSEAAVVTIQPCKSLARVFWRGAVLHGHKFFDNAHSSLLNSFVTKPGFRCLRNRVAIIRRISTRRVVLQLPLDIRQHAAGAKPE